MAARFDFHKQESYSYTRLEHPIIQRNVILRAWQAYYLHPSPGELLDITAILADNGAVHRIRTCKPFQANGFQDRFLTTRTHGIISSATFFYVIVGNIQRIVRLLPTSKNFFGLYVIILYSKWCPLQDLNL